MVVNMSRFVLIIFISYLFTCIRTIIQNEYFLVIDQINKITVREIKHFCKDIIFYYFEMVCTTSKSIDNYELQHHNVMKVNTVT